MYVMCLLYRTANESSTLQGANKYAVLYRNPNTGANISTTGTNTNTNPTADSSSNLHMSSLHETMEILMESYLMDYNSLETKLVYLKTLLHNAEESVGSVYVCTYVCVCTYVRIYIYAAVW